MGETLPPRPTPAQIRKAARKFGTATAKPDGVSPRQFAALSEPALEALGWLFWLFEATGDFPTALQDMTTAMLPKPKGASDPLAYTARHSAYGLGHGDRLRTIGSRP